jgi:hypothetical protein
MPHARATLTTLPVEIREIIYGPLVIFPEGVHIYHATDECGVIGCVGFASSLPVVERELGFNVIRFGEGDLSFATATAKMYNQVKAMFFSRKIIKVGSYIILLQFLRISTKTTSPPSTTHNWPASLFPPVAASTPQTLISLWLISFRW